MRRRGRGTLTRELCVVRGIINATRANLGLNDEVLRVAEELSRDPLRLGLPGLAVEAREHVDRRLVPLGGRAGVPVKSRPEGQGAGSTSVNSVPVRSRPPRDHRHRNRGFGDVTVENRNRNRNRNRDFQRLTETGTVPERLATVARYGAFRPSTPTQRRCATSERRFLLRGHYLAQSHHENPPNNAYFEPRDLHRPPPGRPEASP